MDYYNKKKAALKQLRIQIARSDEGAIRSMLLLQMECDTGFSKSMFNKHINDLIENGFVKEKSGLLFWEGGQSVF